MARKKKRQSGRARSANTGSAEARADTAHSDSPPSADPTPSPPALAPPSATRPSSPATSRPSPSTPAPRSRALLICVGLVLLTALAFGRAVTCAFVNFDDPQYVTANSMVQRGLTGEGVVWAFTHLVRSNWHPITWLSHMLDCQLYGLNPAGHHLTNVALHAANVLLVFLLFRSATGRLWPSAMVAALFGLHPLRVESVAWVAERKDLLSAFFGLSALCAYVWYTERRSVLRYLTVFVLFALGLMSKAMVVTLPFVMLLLDIWPLCRVPLSAPVADATGVGRWVPAGDYWRTGLRLLLEKGPFLALTATICVVTVQTQRSGGALSTLGILSVTERFGNALVSYITHLGETVWPAGLAVFYPLGWARFHAHPLEALPGWQVGGAAVLLATITTVSVLRLRAASHMAVGWLWYIGVLVPVIGIVQVGEQSHADRYTYLPHIGLFATIVWLGLGLAEGRSRNTRRVLTAASAVALVCLTGLTWRQVGFWRNDFTLYEHAIAVTERNYLCYHNLGFAHACAGDLDRAIPLYRKALDYKPWYKDAKMNLGIALHQTGQHEEAIGLLTDSVRSRPSAKLHYVLAKALTLSKRYDDAEQHFREALRLSPKDLTTRFDLGVMFAAKGDHAAAAAVFEEVLNIDTGHASARYNAGFSYYTLGRFDAAVGHLLKLIVMRPDHENALFLLGAAYAQLKKYDEAERHFQALVRLNPGSEHGHSNLGTVYWMKGDFGSACRHYREALRINPASQQAQTNLRKAEARLGDGNK